MPLQFHAEKGPEFSTIDPLSNLTPDNPFNTSAYASAKASAGEEVWLFNMQDGNTLVSGCIGYYKKGRLSSTLEVSSIPQVAENSPFWHELLKFCRQNRISLLDLHSYASSETHIPLIAHQRWRKSRTEYVIDLNNLEINKLSSNHKRNIKRAEKNEVELRVAHDSSACIEHAALMTASMGRRLSRGESVSDEIDPVPFQRLIDAGAGFLHQAIYNNQVVSSVLVLTSPSSGYYHSAGTSPEGMKLGASQFLIWQTAELLHEQGSQHFNLGGADADQTGLVRFKQGFQPCAVTLEAAGFFVGSTLRRILIGSIRDIRQKVRVLLQK